VSIIGLPSQLAVGDTVFISASGGVSPYSWSSSHPSKVQVVQQSANVARVVVLAPYPSVTITATDANTEDGEQIIAAFDFSVRIGDISFTDGDTVLVPVYYTEQSAGLEFLAADIFLPYDTTIFRFTGVKQSGTISNGMSLLFNQVADTVKFGIATSTPIPAAQDAIFIYLKFVSKDTVITPISRTLHFTKFIVNEEYTGLLTDGELTVNPIPNFPPVFTSAVPDTSIDENTTLQWTFAAGDSNGHTVSFVLSLNPIAPNALIDTTTGEFEFATNYLLSGTYQFEVTADDGNGGETPHQFTVTVNNVNRQPYFTTFDHDTVFIAENNFYVMGFTAQDPDAEPLKFSFSNASPGMSIDSLTGVFSWTPDYDQSGIHIPKIHVADTSGGTAVDSLIIVVSNTNRAPLFNAIPDTFFVQEGFPFSYTLTASDQDGDTIRFFASGLQPGMTIDSVTGALEWTPSFDDAGFNFSVTLSVKDPSNAADAVFPFFVIADSNRAPYFTSFLIDTTILEGEAFFFDLSANDLDSGDDLRYYILSGQPPLFEMDSLTGNIYWTPGIDQQGMYTIAVIVTDNKPYGTAVDSFTITVENVNLQPQITTALPDTIFLLENQPFMVDLDATDADSDTLIFSIANPPPGLTIDSLTGIVNWTPDFTQAGNYHPTFKVTDSLGGYDTKYVVMIVIDVNRIPVFTSALSDTTINEGQLLSFTYTASDLDNDSLTFYLILPVTGMTVSPSGVLQWQPNYLQAGIETVVVMASDGQSVAIDTAVVTVLDLNTPPVFTVSMNDTAIARFDTLRFTYQATDAESQPLTFLLAESPVNASISPSGYLEWIPPAGATGEYLFVVQVTDSVATISDTARVRIYRFGDVSGNGVISSFDAGLILRHTIDAIQLSPVQRRIGNVSGDTTVGPLDASLILQYVVGLIDTFPGGLGKRAKIEAQLSAFSFVVVPSANAGEYDLLVSVNKPSNTYGIAMSIGFDTSLVTAKSIKQTPLTDSMMIFTHFPKGRANVSLAGTKPMNSAGEIIRFTFAMKGRNVSNDAVVFTMKRFVLNETDYAGDIGGITLNVKEEKTIPNEFVLGQNYPNPFNPITTIAYQLPADASVSVTVFNLLGQTVKTLKHADQSAGYYSVTWNGMDENNNPVSSGVYLYKIVAQSQGKELFVSTKKMLFLK
jgi:hypothetical protein